ncbi:MAG: hypothetical protein WCO56_05890 [Verrucomicrobiota bacterium]
MRKLLIALNVVGLLVWLALMLANRSSKTNSTAAVTPPGSPAGQPAVVTTKSNAPAPTPTELAMAKKRREFERLSGPALPLQSYEDRRDEILRATIPTELKAEQFLEMVPQLKGEEQEEAVKHLANLLSDEMFPAAAGFLTNADTPEKVREVLMADLLNRNEKLKLPLCLAIARTPDHPQAEDAMKVLTTYFPEDYGSNWTAWETNVSNRLTNDSQ